ncbi:ParB/RepB/Spo0J family partition protein [Streptomyces sp. NPDC057686]|uniref:ParB/RepB/Spo0J family partition protein n=1 Tax=Streptomyces sp. NPDC057686 TaxID=3346212 RepID=UPI0036B3EF6C
MKFHPLADAFPLMEGEAFDELVEDIRKHGLLHPITTYEGMILDGRNRYRGCQHLGIPHIEVKYRGDDPAAWVWSENAVRRQLTPAARAMAATKLATAAKGARSDLGPAGPRSDMTIGDVAKLTGVGRRSLVRARKVERDAVPAVVDLVKEGKLQLAPAVRLSSLPAEEQKEIVETTLPEDIPKAVRARGSPKKPPSDPVEAEPVEFELVKDDPAHESEPVEDGFQARVDAEARRIVRDGRDFAQAVYWAIARELWETRNE